MITVEQLFEEDFTPVWMQRQLQSLQDAVTVGVEYKWKLSAYDSVARISRRFPPKKAIQQARRFQNTSQLS